MMQEIWQESLETGVKRGTTHSSEGGGLDKSGFMSEVGFEPTPSEEDHDLNVAP